MIDKITFKCNGMKDGDFSSACLRMISRDCIDNQGKAYTIAIFLSKFPDLREQLFSVWKEINGSSWSDVCNEIYNSIENGEIDFDILMFFYPYKVKPLMLVQLIFFHGDYEYYFDIYIEPDVKALKDEGYAYWKDSGTYDESVLTENMTLEEFLSINLARYIGEFFEFPINRLNF